MKLYHCELSRSVRVLWTLEELGLDYELEVLPFPPRVFQKSFKEINPLGTVPFFIDGETQMTESSAICHYLVDTYGKGKLAIDRTHKEYGNYLNWLYYSDATITFPQAIILRYSVLESDERKNQQVVDDYHAFLSGRLRKLESELENKQYLCDNRFTIADICVGYSLLFAKVNLKLDDLFTPNITRYYQHLQTRPAFQKASQGEL
jgi:glutathione S-transferase